MRRRILPIVMMLLLLVGCSSEKLSLHGESVNWNVSVSSENKNGPISFVIRYIGEEDQPRNVRYQFAGQAISPSGSMEKLSAPYKEISFQSDSNDYESETLPIPVHIRWNRDQEETIYVE
ncbi:hypothetical protein [Paenibacillus tundrae]